MFWAKKVTAGKGPLGRVFFLQVLADMGVVGEHARSAAADTTPTRQKLQGRLTCRVVDTCAYQWMWVMARRARVPPGSYVADKVSDLSMVKFFITNSKLLILYRERFLFLKKNIDI